MKYSQRSRCQREDLAESAERARTCQTPSQSAAQRRADVRTSGKRSWAGRMADLSVGTVGDARGGEDHTHTHTPRQQKQLFSQYLSPLHSKELISKEYFYKNLNKEGEKIHLWTITQLWKPLSSANSVLCQGQCPIHTNIWQIADTGIRLTKSCRRNWLQTFWMFLVFPRPGKRF